MWKIKDLIEYCETEPLENVIRVYTLDERGDEVFFDDNFLITTRKPRRTEFSHSECVHCEKICFKGVKRLYCKYWEDIILKRDIFSCENFEHWEEDLDYFE